MSAPATVTTDEPPISSRMPFGTGTVLLATFAIIAQVLDAIFYRGHPLLGMYHIVAMTVVVVRLMIGTLASRDPIFRRFRGWKSATVALLATSLAVSVLLGGGKTVCPHGRLIMAGPVGLAISAVGGPCRNERPNRIAWHLYRDVYFVID